MLKKETREWLGRTQPKLGRRINETVDKFYGEITYLKENGAPFSKVFRHEACFACWQYWPKGAVQMTGLKYDPMLHAQRPSPDQERMMKIAYNTVMRPIFPQFPTWAHLRDKKRGTFFLDTTTMHLKEANVICRFLRTPQEHVSIMESMAWARYHFPEAPAPLLAAMAITRKINKNGITKEMPECSHHYTFYPYTIQDMGTMMRVFAWIQDHEGRLFVDEVEIAVPERNSSYQGSEAAVVSNPDFLVKLGKGFPPRFDFLQPGKDPKEDLNLVYDVLAHIYDNDPGPKKQASITMGLLKEIDPDINWAAKAQAARGW